MPFKVAAVSSHIKSKWSLFTLAKSIGYTQLARCTRLRLTWGKLILLLFHPTLLQTCSTPLLVSDSGSYLYVCCVAFFLFLLTSKLKMNKLCLESESSGPFFRFSDNNQLLVYLGNWRLHLKFIAQNCHCMIKWPLKLLTGGRKIGGLPGMKREL